MRAHLIPVAMSLITAAACSSPSASSNPGVDAGGRDGTAATDGSHGRGEAGGGGDSSPGSGDTGSAMEGGSGEDGSASMVTPGNGCAAALGINAGFYTCARQWFVSTTGDDANDGKTPSHAKKTLGGATALSLSGGDCVTVETGTYDESVVVTTSGSGDSCTGYVVFRSATKGTARLTSADPYVTVAVQANFVVFDGFDVTNSNTGSGLRTGTNDKHVYHHFTAIRNYIHDAGGAGLAAIHADYVRFEGNVVTNNSLRDPYDDSGIDLWEAQASDTLPGFHNIIRNNLSYKNAEWNVPSPPGPTDGEGILIDSFDYADPNTTYGPTTPYAQETLIENNVVFGNGGRGIEVGGAGPSSYVTVRNNTVFDDARQQQPWSQSELASDGRYNTWDNNIAILGPDATDGPMSELSTVFSEECGNTTNTGTVWRNNIAFSMLSGDRLAYSGCTSSSIVAADNVMGKDPQLVAPSLSATSAAPFRLGPTSPAIGAGASADFAPFDYDYVKRRKPPSIGAFEP